MDTNVNQRKRGGRVAKNTNVNEGTSSPQSTEPNEVMEVSAVAMSPTFEESDTAVNAPAAECRRSSRKKIIKFDVRDLLNKNRKTHKIQIEARIDSNAPTTSKAAAVSGAEASNSKATSTLREDMLSKQKTFLEKSAIFRRYSVSQDNKPPPPPLPMPPMLGKTNDNIESNPTASSRRFNRTQEFFSNVMIKPKQTTSLIVAQIESNTPSSVTTQTKRKSLNKSTKINFNDYINNSPIVQQKKRGRPAKFKAQALVQTMPDNPPHEEEVKKKLTPEKAKNWKEYKACLANQTSSDIKKTEDKSNEIKKDIINVSRVTIINLEETQQSDNCKSEDYDRNFSGFHTSKDSPLLVEAVKEKSPKENQIHEIITEAPTEDKTETQIEKVENIFKRITRSSPDLSKQRNAIEVKNDDQKPDKEENVQVSFSPENYIVETEDNNIKTSGTYNANSKHTKRNTRSRLRREESTTSEESKDSEKTTKTDAVVSTNTQVVEIETVIDSSSDLVEENKPTPIPLANIILTSQIPLSHPSIPSECTIKPFSRTSSSSESENASERSSYSTDPSSSGSSSRSYKSGDKLRVSLKRISLPKSPSTSSQTSTSEELNTSHKLNVLPKKPPIAKRSKRLQKKFVEMLETKDDEESINDDDYLQRNHSDEKEQSEETLNTDDQVSLTNIALSMSSYEVDAIPDATKTSLDDSIYTYTVLVNLDSESNQSSNMATDVIRQCKDNQCYKEEGKQEGEESVKSKILVHLQEELLKTSSDEQKVTESDQSDDQRKRKSLRKLQEMPIGSKGKQIDNSKAELKKEEVQDFKIQEHQLKTLSDEHKVTESDQSEESNESSQSKKSIRRQQPTRKSIKEQKISVENVSTFQEENRDKSSQEIDKEIGLENLKATYSQEEKSKKGDNSSTNLHEKEIETPESGKDETRSPIENLSVNKDADVIKIKNPEIRIKNKKITKLQIEIQTDTEGKKLSTQPLPDETKLTEENLNSGDKKTCEENMESASKPISTRSLNKNESLTRELKIEEAHLQQSTMEADPMIKAGLEEETAEDKRNPGTPRRSKTNKNVEVENLTSSRSESPKCSSFKADVATTVAIQETPTISTRSKTIKEEETSKETYAKPSIREKERSKSPKEDLKTTETAKKVTTTRRKTYKEETITQQTKIPENNEDEECVATVGRGKKESGETFGNQENKSDQAKTNKEESFETTPTRSRAKETDVHPVSPKYAAKSSEQTSQALTKVIDALQSDEVNPSAEAPNNKTFDDSVSTPTIAISMDASQSSETQESSSSSKITINIADKSCSTKRKSLRKLKDHTTAGKSQETITESLETTVNKEQEIKSKVEEPQVVDVPKIINRKGRKSRFKNLYGPDIESETDSSNGNNTSFKEIMKQKLMDAKEIEPPTSTALLPEKPLEIPCKAKETEERREEILEDDKGKSESNLLSSQIQNVSIETNTLLDILRTVQSNTEAALKANKSADIGETNKDFNILKTENENETTAVIDIETKISEEPRQISPTRSTESPPIKKFTKISQELKTTSPARSATESPMTIKKTNSSPARSETASPLTLKKVAQSPTRSDSSSPLTLKKVARRYERRSRRGEDSRHKTLEETFAEIAAQSSKAVLTAKEFDGVESDNTTEENVQQLQEIDYVTTQPSSNKEQIIENFNEIVEKTSIDIVEESLLRVEEKVDHLEETGQVESVDKTDIICKQTKNEVESVFETPDANKITPARRGRKSKNRNFEVPVEKDDSAKDSNKNNMETVIIQKEIEDEVKESENQQNTSAELLLAKGNTKTENKTNKPKKIKATTGLAAVDNKTTDILPESDIIPPDQHSITKDVLEITEEIVNEGKNIKNKRELSKTQTLSEDFTISEFTTTKDDLDVRTPKQSAKKRDTSQTKNETKSMAKKIPKKSKTDEEDDSVAKAKSNSSIATTPPPTKRGRKPKNQQPDTTQSSTSCKKKTQKDSCTDNTEDVMSEEKTKTVEHENDAFNTSLDKSLDEKLAKKKRQKKLKEAFEAALTEDTQNQKETNIARATNFGLTVINNSPSPERRTSFSSKEETEESQKITCVTPAETEDQDPLKDIEKFIADGVNLLKKDYKLDEDSVDDVIPNPTNTTTTEVLEEPTKSSSEETRAVLNTFETPADTPINTPSVTPPPKSPTSIESSTPDENSGVRRSHRIKLITKTPKALVGRGLVRDKERFSIKDDVETKSHYTLDDHLTDLAEVEAKNAKFLKEMEERLSNFQVIKENEYLCERVISREARKMICDCFLTHDEEERGELACGEDCLNRLLMIECGPDCNVKERCTNKRFQKLLCSPCRVFRTEKKGFGIMADIEILPGEFIMEYVGEVIDTDEFEKRRIMYSQDKNRHYYFMALRSDAIIDATIKGNISRFINHSCDPNAETQKWTVNGELRIGFFSRKSIMPGEEITFNYQYQRYGREAQRCYCESSNCTGWIGQEPASDEGEQIDDDEYEESEDEEADTSNLLVQDDDEDSDASVADPEEVQKQLEMAAAQAEVELAPLQLMEEKAKQAESVRKGESALDSNKTESEEDSKSKFKKLLSKMAEKVAAKQKQNKREQKMQRKKKSKESSTDLTNKLKFLEDPDIEDEVEFLKECGLKNQSDTLRLSRLMVRAKLVQTRLNLLEILRQGELPCRRLFLDYHGLRLVHGWMSEDAGNMQIRLALLQTLETLPIANKTVLTDSKVMQVVRNWCGQTTNFSPNEDSSSSNSNSQDATLPNSTNPDECSMLQKLAMKLITTWDGLPEIFRIPKKERIEQMKEHEREADRQYAANAETQENTTATDRYRRDRFGRGINSFYSSSTTSFSNRFTKPNNGNLHRTTNTTPRNNKHLSKAQRREMFAAKVARDEAEKRLAEERREFETKCRFFGLDPKKTRIQDIPFCVNPATGQWFSIERKPINTPPSYAHVQVPVKAKSTDPNDYQLPAVCSTLPPQWKYAITPQGKIYYYHIKHRIPQWEPPSPAQLHQCEIESKEEDSESELTTTAGEDSSDDEDDILIGMDAAQLKAYIDRKVELRRQKRYQRLVDERSISPRREEDRIYNQIEMRKYKENKEKIRKRKEEIRRKRAEALRQTFLNMCTLGSVTESNPNANNLNSESDADLGALPIQDYLLSSDEEVDLKAEVNSPLIDKIVEGDKIVDELDALTTKRQLKRPLPPHRDLNEPSTSSTAAVAVSTPGLNTVIARHEYKKRKLEKKEKRKPKEQDPKYRKNKEKFRCDIAGIIVHYLKPYRKDTCTVGRIQSNEDFNHLARKLTHFVMIKELKYCESVGQTLVVTESVKTKSREFIKKYMAKYGEVYVKPSNDPDFKDIPFTL